VRSPESAVATNDAEIQMFTASTMNHSTTAASAKTQLHCRERQSVESFAKNVARESPTSKLADRR